MNVNCVIIDDESNIRELIKSIIEDNFSNINVVGTADTVSKGLKEINVNQPHLIFLDIELPDGTGFDILESIQNENYKIIFISAYNEYAIKAFKYSAVDYILKPLNIIDFIKSVNRAVDTIQDKKEYSVLLDNLRDDYPSKLALQDNEGITYIDVNDIQYISGDGRYSTIKTANNKEFVESKLLSFYEEILNPNMFFRIHKSFLINLLQVKAFRKNKGGQVKMNDGTLLNISRLKKEEFLKKMSEV